MLDICVPDNENIEEQNNSVNLSQSNSLNNSILNQLIDLGINPIYAKRIYKYYHPLDIYEALDYFYSNNGIIQHHFIENKKKSNNDCYLCGEKREIHLGYIQNDNNDEDIQYLDSESKLNKSNIDNKKEDIKEDKKVDKKEDKKEDIKEDIKEDKKEDIKETINTEDIKLDVEPKNICEVCLENFISNEHNKIEKCGHSFCNNCWFQYLSIKIEENKISSIKCLDDKCEEKLTDDFIFQLLNNDENLIKKYKRYKFEYEIINDPNKKFCPFPNCDSYLELKDIRNKDVKCLNNHSFCFLCLKEPHGKLPCEQNLDSSMIEFAKNNFIKFCPNCHILTEKTTGCNHINCTKCNYKWCWLCNENYIDVNHYKNGKCKGLQFFRPENEYDIKLAFEGKIQLSESQIQIDEEVFENIININIDDSFDVNEDLPSLENELSRESIINKKKIFCSKFLWFLYYFFLGYHNYIYNESNNKSIINGIHEIFAVLINIILFLIYYPIHFHITILYFIFIYNNHVIIKDLLTGYFFESINISKRIYNSNIRFYRLTLIFINILFFIIFYPIHFHITLFYRIILYFYY